MSDQEFREQPQEEVISADVYGIKTRVREGDLDSDPKTPLEAVSWKEVGKTVNTCLKHTCIGLGKFMVEIPRTATSVLHGVKGLMTIPQAIGERIRKGRAQVEHHEEEKIEETIDNASALTRTPEERNDEGREAAVKVRELIEHYRALGIPVNMSFEPDGRILVTIVDPGMHDKAVEMANDEVKRLEQKSAQPIMKEQVSRYNIHGEQLIESLDIPSRIVNILKENGISIVSQLELMTVDQLLSIKGIGPSSVQGLKKYLKEE